MYEVTVSIKYKADNLSLNYQLFAAD